MKKNPFKILREVIRISGLISASFLLFSCNLQKKPEIENLDFAANKNKNYEIASSDFVSSSQDIPLLDALKQINDDESLGFDSDSGSISSASYESSISLAKVKNFYLKTLPQMDWKLTGNEEDKLSFTREKEKVEIEFINKDGANIVRFFMSSTL